MTQAQTPTTTYYCGQPISELPRKELEAIVKEAGEEIQKLQAENSRLRREQFINLRRHL